MKRKPSLNRTQPMVPTRIIQKRLSRIRLTKKRVLFFHASWCPNCKNADKEITASLEAVPDDVVIFKTDYDSENALKKKYGITSQHTFVYVDSEGNAIDKWSGGSTLQILEKVNG